MLLKGWNISEAARSKAASGDFSHFYDTICTEAFPGNGGKYFDKTPIYMSMLGRCMSRAPDLEGAVVIHRNPRAVFLSMATRISPKLDAVKAVEKNFDNLVARYMSYFHGCIGQLWNPRVLFVPFEELVSRE